MANERSNDAERATPPAQVEKDAAIEHTQPDTPAGAPRTPEDVRAEAETEDRFEATDN
jgi:hypothetical protein